MAGSMYYFLYNDDLGNVFWSYQDKSNALLMGATPIDNLGHLSIPRHTRPRHVVYSSTDGVVTRKIPYPKRVTDLTTLPQSITDAVTQAAGHGTLFFKRYVPERIKVPQLTDTGQTV